MIGTIAKEVDASRRILDEMVSTPKDRASPLGPFVARVYFDISAAYFASRSVTKSLMGAAAF
jgi:hypothetical protein